MDELRHLPITSLREPKVKLREVRRDSLEYLEMRDSIRQHGILQPLLVRPRPRCPGRRLGDHRRVP